MEIERFAHRLEGHPKGGTFPGRLESRWENGFKISLEETVRGTD